MKNKENKKINNSPFVVKVPILIAITLACGILIGANLFDGHEKMNFVYDGASRYREVLSRIETSYVDSVNTDTLVDYSIKKMLEKLDPHTSYIPVGEMAMAKAGLESGFDGIGIEFNLYNDTLYVLNVMPNGPSETAGLKSGDKILKADGVALSGSKVAYAQIYKSLRGKRGSEVRLEILPLGEKKNKNITIVRDRIPTFSIAAAYMLDRQTGYIKVDRFSETTYTEFKQYLEKLKKEGMQRMVLDLRGNPGGYKDRAEKVVDELLAGEKLIVSTDGRGTAYDSKTYTKTKGLFEEGPIVVLIDEGSASASEIVSGALQDNDRALIVGRRSFGKGLVQAQMAMSDGAELRLTISRYYTPSGRSIQKPYALGGEVDYGKDLEKRKKTGEFYYADSIKVNKKMAFKTNAGRIVYGGGGIVPDIFVPKDTMAISPYLAELSAKNLLRGFALSYANENRISLLGMTFPVFSKSFYITEEQLNVIINQGRTMGIKYNEKDFLRSRTYMKIMIKAYIARNIWRNLGKDGLSNEYYQIIYPVDETLRKAMTYFDKAIALEKMQKK